MFKVSFGAGMNHSLFFVKARRIYLRGRPRVAMHPHVMTVTPRGGYCLCHTHSYNKLARAEEVALAGLGTEGEGPNPSPNARP